MYIIPDCRTRNREGCAQPCMPEDHYTGKMKIGWGQAGSKQRVCQGSFINIDKK